ncbi:uncharacterized protein KY384_003172 [Bacidia gigantensis]|uniref:uncharacterized protein n=1 Tax=Bacidia gigantensis TaxID=2732470 RepID=UPI001D054364|nr:uncharacterized protein KY384_003172 [Bacidia gigantensis]KAG8531542.1 hypothetical protein KY384_003172 [Bacidia gigantensis]
MLLLRQLRCSSARNHILNLPNKKPNTAGTRSFLHLLEGGLGFVADLRMRDSGSTKTKEGNQDDKVIVHSSMVVRYAPLPFNVGTDITNVHRIARLLWDYGLSQGFIRRVFTRLEWPVLQERFQHAFNIDGGESGVLHLTKAPGSNLCLLNAPLRALSKSNEFDIEIRHPSTPLSRLATFIAGRWAAKEAVIKAYSSRRLFMSEISVLRPAQNPRLFPAEQRTSLQTMTLIDPISDTILLGVSAALLRRLRGSTSTLLKGVEAKTGVKEYHERRSKVKDEQRRLGKVSISHDGEYATATCILPHETPIDHRCKRIIDDGIGPPKHEPEYGDAGWLDYEPVTTDINIS